MFRIYDPAQLKPPMLRQFAVLAAWIATRAESTSDLEDLLVDVPREERILPDFSTPWLWDIDAFVVALSIVQQLWDAAEKCLEEQVATWLREDREN